MLATSNAARIPLADGVVHACITSPPYYRQRRYGVVCDWPAVSFRPSLYLSEQWHVEPWRGEMGWEPHVLDYIGHLVLVYREVYRVLREDGQNWLNISDKRTGSREWFRVPEMLVGALAADGWRHEDTVIWHKESAMPGSQQNRFTRDFEYIYRLNKSRDDFFDIDAVREPAAESTQARAHLGKCTETPKQKAMRASEMQGDGDTLSVYDRPFRTRRTVWTINPEGLNLPHYAAYPRELVRVMLKASVSERGVCPTCGKPWQRVVERKRDGRPLPMTGKNEALYLDGTHGAEQAQTWNQLGRNVQRLDTTTTWRPSCTCAGKPSRGPVRCGRCRGTGREQLHVRGTGDWTQGSAIDGQHQSDTRQTNICKTETGAPCPHCTDGTTEGDVWPADVDTWPVAPAIVLDPFVGSGTTAVVCQELRQLGMPVKCVGLDLNHHYLRDLARERLGLLALEAWEGGKDGNGGHSLEELPLFQSLEAVPA